MPRPCEGSGMQTFVACPALRRVTALRTVGRSGNGELGVSDVDAVPSAPLIAIFRSLPARISRRQYSLIDVPLDTPGAAPGLPAGRSPGVARSCPARVA